jgi:hypothetical protein
LPTVLNIEGHDYEINTDFRSCLKIIMAFEDNELTSIEKQSILFHNLYGSIMPENVQEAGRMALWFLNGGKEQDDQEPGSRLYSFSKDAALIFAAFRQTHGIDLQKADLHWWEFVALFMDIGGETAFSNLTGLRSRVKDGTATKEERKMALKMGEAFDLPEVDDRTIEEREKEAEFMRLIKGDK